MEPSTHRSYGPNGGPSGGAALLEPRHGAPAHPRRDPAAQVRRRAARPILDPEGNPDTSFLAKIPADTPFTFQTLDRNGLVLNMAQTWHQVRPGEMRADCGGCHAHSQQPLAFAGHGRRRSRATRSPTWCTTTPLLTHRRRRLAGARAVEPVPSVDVEFIRDIRPLLQRSCVPCHTKNAASPPGNLVLDDTRR